MHGAIHYTFSLYLCAALEHCFLCVFVLQMQQAVEEKSAVSAQLRAVSQTLRETQLSLSELQNRYYWIANQQQIQHSPAQV